MANRIIFGSILLLAQILSPALSQAGFTPKPLAGPAEDQLVLGLTAIYQENNSRDRFFRSHGPLEPGRLADLVLKQACRHLNAPYRLGASLQSSQATDCSGFVQFVYKKSNISLPRASVEQARVGAVAARRLDFAKLAPGDLLFFRDGEHHIGHVGIYLGEGKMIHAANHSHGVTVSDLHRPFYLDNFVVAKRLLDGRPGLPAPVKSSLRSALN